jgi:hypothetical protein
MQRERLQADVVRVCTALGDDAPHAMVFGCAALACYPLEGLEDVRRTEDVDIVFDARRIDIRLQERVARARFDEFVGARHRFQRRLTQPEGDPPLSVDLVFRDDLSASDEWLVDAFYHASPIVLDGVVLALRVIPPVHFIAVKLRAALDRGREPEHEDKDIGDVVEVLAHLRGIRDVISADSASVSVFVRDQLIRNWFDVLTDLDRMAGLLHGSAESQARAPVVAEWLRTLP